MEYERIILQTIEEILKQLGVPPTNINLEIIESEESKGYRVNIECEEPNHLIGRQGDTLKALEHITKLMFKKQIIETDGEGKTPRLEIDVHDYRKKQVESVLNMAEQKAGLVRETNKAQTLPPMSGYLRRMVHLHITRPEYQDLETYSVGNGRDRQITIKPKGESYA